MAPNLPSKQSSHATLPQSPASENDDDSPANTSRSIPMPPDGGYGWVIAVASFFSNAVVDGTCSVFALLLPSLLSHYDGSRGKTTLAGSLMVGGFLMSGPISGASLNKFGCRVTAMSGALLLTSSLIASTFSPSLTLFILLYGALGGLGLGLIYMPATVMVGFYFEKKRAVATGIATAGAGAGMILFSIITAALLEHYDWRATLIIVSGISLQALVLGALMRPLEDDLRGRVRGHIHTAEDMSRALDVDKECKIELFNESSHALAPVTTTSGHDISKPENGGLKNMRAKVFDGKIHLGVCRDKDYSQSCGALDSHDSLNVNRMIASRSVHDDHQPVHKSQGNISKPHVPHRSNVDLRKQLLSNPLVRDDIFYSGSVHNLPEYKASHDRESYISSYVSLQHTDADHASDVSHQSQSCLGRLFAWMKTSPLFDTELLRSSPFLVILLANFLCHVAMHVPMVFIADYAISLGISPRMAATLMTAIGVCTVVGRAGAGALGSLSCVQSHLLSAVSLIIAGVASLISVHVCTDYASLLVYAIVYGLMLAVFVPLTTVLLVQYIGLHKLTRAYGLLSLIKGIACFVGPPIAGSLMDRTGSYMMAFCLAGVLFLSSGVVFWTVPLAYNRQKQSQNIALKTSVTADQDV